MPIPDAVRERIAIYRGTGRIKPRAGELFTDLSWFYVLDGMGIVPMRHDPLIDVADDRQFRRHLAELARSTAEAVRTAPAHDSHFAAAAAAVQSAPRRVRSILT